MTQKRRDIRAEMTSAMMDAMLDCSRVEMGSRRRSSITNRRSKL